MSNSAWIAIDFTFGTINAFAAVFNFQQGLTGHAYLNLFCAVVLLSIGVARVIKPWD